MKRLMLLFALVFIVGVGKGYCVHPVYYDTVFVFVDHIDEDWMSKSDVELELRILDCLGLLPEIKTLNFVLYVDADTKIVLQPTSADGKEYVELVPKLAGRVDVSVTENYKDDPNLVLISISSKGDNVMFDDTNYWYFKHANGIVGKIKVDFSGLLGGKHYVKSLGDWPVTGKASNVVLGTGQTIYQHAVVVREFEIRGDLAIFDYDLMAHPIGDVNFDGNVNVNDVSSIYTCILSGEYNVACDLNGNGFVNVEDVSKLYKIILDQ